MRLRYALACVGAVMTLSTGTAFAAEQKLTASDGGPNQLTGGAVAVEGDTAVVGAPFTVGTAGSVLVFTRTGDTWTQSAVLTASDGAVNDALGYAVDIDGETIVAGAFGDDSNRGAVYTFARTGPATRFETAKLVASDGVATDQLGVSVAIDGGTIAAGASQDDVAANAQGSVYRFDATGPTPRMETAKLTASDGALADQLGQSVDIDGDTIAAGAFGDDSFRGAIYTFESDGSPTPETARLTANERAANDQLGSSVAIEGDTIVAGAIGDDAARGSLYTFSRTGVTPRTETAKLTASDGASDDILGQSLAIDGSAIVAGAPRHAFGGNANQGAVYRFARSGDAARHELSKTSPADGAPNDRFGSSVDIFGDTLIGGAQFDDVGSNVDQGSATVFFQASGGGTATDTVPPALELTAKKSQVAGKPLKLEAEANEACELDLSGSAKPKGEKKGKLKPLTEQLAAGAKESLKLKAGGKLKQALKDADKGKAKIAGTCTDAAGNPSQDALKVKLK